MKATNNLGALNPVPCTINVAEIPITIYILPAITDSKGALYTDIPIIGRSFPVKTYAHSENRTIGMSLYFYAETRSKLKLNLSYHRLLQSATYPRESFFNNLPFRPPPICTIKCGSLLSNDPLSVVLLSYELEIPRDVPWDDEFGIPYYWMVKTNWNVVYDVTRLPGQEKIWQDIPR